MKRFTGPLAFALAMLVTPASNASAATPSPKPSHASTTTHPVKPTAHLPTVPLHSEVVVEVNKRGQVVRVKSTKPSKMQGFNLETYGNALQMWIRKPDGTATVGLYRVTYDYDPKTLKVTRHVALISEGGSWGDQPGAATVMMEMAKKQAAAAQKKAADQNTKLPSLNEIRGVPTPSPTHNATLPP